MPWKETSPMDERVKFVAAMLEAEESFLEPSDDRLRSAWKLAHALEGNVTDGERVKFVAAMLEAEESFLELCERFGISRASAGRQQGVSIPPSSFLRRVRWGPSCASEDSPAVASACDEEIRSPAG
jgi:hypothetical protein